jgi:transcriptional regulator with GAF, ATPase, and Fis domain
MVTGISNDRTSEELRELREIRQKAAANARISRELAGTDAKRAETEFLEYAQASETDNEFDQLIGLAAKKEASSSAVADVKVPES